MCDESKMLMILMIAVSVLNLTWLFKCKFDGCYSIYVC